ncbi:MAG: hypothetical protein KAS86_05550, partial [Candidatus Omnitrophica bacterium]|nr:hypothetical protein [Candidatus Omnitrophota bacterium]
MKKIVILYSTAGMGHKKAAIALFRAFRKRGDNVSVSNIDTLDYATKFYKFLYLDLYVFLMTRARWLWGILYYLSDTRIVDKFMRKFRGSFDLRSLRGLEAMLVKERPDAIVATHFILPGIAGVIKRRMGTAPRLYVGITDYGPHAFWLSEDIDRFFIGAGSMTAGLVKRGIREEKITVTGIPAVEEFSNEFDAEALRGTYGLDPGRKTVFVLSGGFGVGPMESILLSLRSCRVDIQVITVCGHNKRAYDRIDALRPGLNYPVKLFGFTDKIAELMAVSDLMITKAGGISVTEALDMCLPMILFASVPGQETWNERLLLGAGAAEKAGSVDEIPGLV